MNTTILQIPMSKKLKKEAEAAARDMGFSSLQEWTRILLTKLSKRELLVEIKEQYPAVYLSTKAERRYNKISKDIDEGKNVTTAKNLDELFKLLNA